MSVSENLPTCSRWRREVQRLEFGLESPRYTGIPSGPFLDI